MSDLLPCPFCGGKAESIEIDAEHGDTNFGGSVIQCSRCFASSHVEFGFKENLVSAWNSRSSAARNAALEDAEIARLRDACNQSRLAFAGYVSAQSAIDALDRAALKGDDNG